MTLKDPEHKNVPRQKQHQTQKLDRTIQELESALSAWDHLSDAAPTATPTEAVSNDERELRKKTRELLSEIRAQLTDLDN